MYSLSLLLSVFLFSLLFLVAELLIRRSYLGVQGGRYDVEETVFMPTKLKSNFQGEMWGIPFSTNRYGFRDEEDFSEVPSPGTFRILSLGDSVGFGVSIQAKDHYSKVAQRRLNGLDSKKYYIPCPGISPQFLFLYYSRPLHCQNPLRN